MIEYSIAEFLIEDYDAAISLWRDTEGIGLSSADSRECIAVYLERNPRLSFVARSNEEMIGAVLCGHDGRRGYLHHLAVHSTWRGRGVGRALTAACLAGLQVAGIDKCHLFVFNENHSGREYWEHEGWKERLDLLIMSKEF